MINSRPNCALIGPGGGFYRRARQSCDNVSVWVVSRVKNVLC